MRDHGTPQLYVRVVIVGIWSVIVSLVAVIIAAGSLSTVSEGSTGTEQTEASTLSFVGLLGGLFAGLLEAGLSGIAVGVVLVAAGVYFFRGTAHSMRSNRRGGLRGH